MVRRSKRICARVGGCSCGRRHRPVRAVTCRPSSSTAPRLADARFSCDLGSTNPDYDYTRADSYTASVGDHGDTRPTSSDGNAASTTTDVNAHSTHSRAADINADSDDYAHEYTYGLDTGFSSTVEGWCGGTIPFLLSCYINSD